MEWVAGRRRLLLVVGFQRRFILQQFVGLIIALALLVVVVFFPAIIDLLSSDPDVRLAAADRFLALHELAWPLIGLVLPAVALLMVLNTHRLAGPLYRFRRVFDDVERGDLTMRVKTRRRDYLIAEADGLDRMVASLRERIGSAQTQLDRAHREVTELAHQEQFVAAAGVTAVAESIARAQAILDQFDTDPSTRTRSEREESRAGRGAEHPGPGATPSERLSRSRGFTLVEILVVVTLIGTLALLAMPAYEHALHMAQVTRAMGDVKNVGREAQLQSLLKGCLPSSLTDMDLGYLRDPWGRQYTYGVIAKPQQAGPPLCTACSGGCITIAQARQNSALVPVNSDFDLYSAGRDAVTDLVVTTPNSADDIVRANDGGYVGLGADY